MSNVAPTYQRSWLADVAQLLTGKLRFALRFKFEITLVLEKSSLIQRIE